GKSAAAAALAASTGRPVVVAVAGVAEQDAEMQARIEEHRRARPAGWRVLEVAGKGPAVWLREVSDDECLLVDCLGTLIASATWPPDTDLSAIPYGRAGEVAEQICDELIARRGDTIVVTNEVGMGVVPHYPSGRAFADALGMANRRLAKEASAAFLVVCGRLLDLKALSSVEDLAREHRRDDD
ncbi:MAG: bifunctional adenosylcobinamide kinase/adenosylcobinamide-phosphate guanylyltransferase, partial [Coriobacteriia bacterium]|nr:bifunctional adenosylcobinamide kinase/adenosylcobinamide-phosphate guanylyltransferase [Coriobacteriia bacterium]